jgi:predicted  nucleic acid-binding Zn-ribbon protein
MILRGEVIKEERMYVLVDRDSEIMHLKEVISEKEKEIKNLNETISDLNTAISDLEYQLSNTDKGGDRALAEKIYKFLVYQY